MSQSDLFVNPEKHLPIYHDWSDFDFYQKRMNLLSEIIQKSNGDILPNTDNVFKAYELTPFNRVRVVILGQDPYPTKGDATGLAFSVDPDQPLPKSLANIYTEMQADIGCRFMTGDLTHWAEQGVFLLNSVLTTEVGKSMAHKNMGWETFTGKSLKSLIEFRQGLIFLLWGAAASQNLYMSVMGDLRLLDRNRHVTIRSAHPSPRSAYMGFFGSRPFSRINNLLKASGQVEINWC